jgi:hypothetical protein
MLRGSSMQEFILIGVLLLIFSSCKMRDETQAVQINETEADSACYVYVQGRDSIKLSLRQRQGKIRGDLQFGFYEKDKSYGTIEGEMKGDTLFANYSFTSEGTLSSREVALLKRDDSFILGSGDIANSGNTDVFKDRETIEFGDGVILKNTDCNKIF